MYIEWELGIKGGFIVDAEVSEAFKKVGRTHFHLRLDQDVVVKPKVFARKVK